MELQIADTNKHVMVSWQAEIGCKLQTPANTDARHLQQEQSYVVCTYTIDPHYLIFPALS